ncbi:nucleoside diphosphate kinase regulator [Marinagarivorans cellulosilyticus]|uniref:Regulator of nucleoside diphosphate kinase n=1 Tax=Marinagarivorans cellulosilyticus TaxID=2721545 RepID=A0AAN2BL80_9GAMM|nr:nucleoside diphosphate kinase regulator [Marinagarivorans cellulosilyticus]BCD98853.1 regulator of nucleoside diphosphate kinase [Marinagarivorans cellulosilyticus]
MKKPNVIISQSDYLKISNLLDTIDGGQNCDNLIEELERAQILPDKEMPDDVVKMHSTVTFSIATTHRTFTLKLVYPYERDKEKSISILTPAGSALIGLSVGQRIEWSLTQNSAPTTVTVKSVSN